MCKSPEKCLHVEVAQAFAGDLGRQFNEERAKTKAQSLTIIELMALADTCVRVIEEQGLCETARLINRSLTAIKARVSA